MWHDWCRPLSIVFAITRVCCRRRLTGIQTEDGVALLLPTQRKFCFREVVEREHGGLSAIEDFIDDVRREECKG